MKYLTVLLLLTLYNSMIFGQTEPIDYYSHRDITEHVSSSHKKIKTMEVIRKEGRIGFNAHLAKYLQFDSTKRKQVKRDFIIRRSVYHYNTNKQLLQKLEYYNSDTATTIENYWRDSMMQTLQQERIDCNNHDTSKINFNLVQKNGKLVLAYSNSDGYSYNETWLYDERGNCTEIKTINKNWYSNSTDTTLRYYHKFYTYDSNYNYLTEKCEEPRGVYNENICPKRLIKTIFTYNGKQQLVHKERFIYNLDEPIGTNLNPRTQNDYYTYNKKGQLATIYKTTSDEKDDYEKMILHYNKKGLIKSRYSDSVNEMGDSIIYETYRYSYW